MFRHGGEAGLDLPPYSIGAEDPARIARADNRVVHGPWMGEYQESDFVAVVAGDDDVERDVRKMLERLQSDEGGAHPRPAHQLEILGDAAVETQPRIRIVRIDELHGVLGDKEAFVIERLLRFLRVAIVPLEDVRSLETQLEATVLIGNQLQRNLRQRHADVARSVDGLVGLGRGGRCLRQAPSGEHQWRLATNLFRELFERGPDLLRDGRSSVEDQIAIAEISALERLVLLHRGDELRKTNRHIEDKVSGVLADVACGRRKSGFRRLALVEVEAAAVGKHEIEIVVAAKDVAPR